MREILYTEGIEPRRSRQYVIVDSLVKSLEACTVLTRLTNFLDT
jgi:hypothetical protein